MSALPAQSSRDAGNDKTATQTEPFNPPKSASIPRADQAKLRIPKPIAIIKLNKIALAILLCCARCAVNTPAIATPTYGNIIDGHPTIADSEKKAKAIRPIMAVAMKISIPMPIALISICIIFAPNAELSGPGQ